ncbi:MAG: Flp pilus assembly protein CpaB [Micrococcales bacterium]|nr:Flp pilus assembly protein CpaB [Micrococcales bacterium]MCL2667284.1 Flp pilus assembly protein CpaB [Micrococcales bacterium]
MLVFTTIGAIAVFISVLAYVGDVSRQVGNTVRVLRLTKAVDVFMPIDSSAYEVIEVPERWTSGATFHSERQLAGMVAASVLPKGAYLQEGMVMPEPRVTPGTREIAIVVDAETGVAGKISPGDYVDIIATFAGGEEVPARSMVVISNAQIVDVGVVTETTGGDFAARSGVPVTFALTSQEALELAYVESFSIKLRLALRGPGDNTVLPPDKRVYEGG